MLEIIKKKKVVKIEGVTYEMKAPTYNDSVQYQETLEAAGKDSGKLSDALFSYLAKLGMPENVSKDLEVEDVLSIINYLSGEKKS